MGQLLRGSAVFCILAALSLPSAMGQQTSEEIASLRKELDALKVAQRQLQSDVGLIKGMLLGKQVTPEAPPLQDVVIGIAGAASMGSPTAKVVLIEFSDYQCPFCARYANDTFWALAKTYVNTEKIQYVFRNFPLRDAHPSAEKAAEAAECAGEQGKYWEVHERLFRNQLTLNGKPLASEVSPIGIDELKFRNCLDTGKSGPKINADIAEGVKVGVDATPTFFFGYRDDKEPSRVRALKILTGAQPVASFAQILEYLLDRAPVEGGNR